MSINKIIKFMTFNISAEMLCQDDNVNNIINIIKKANPDIIGIQETKCNKSNTSVAKYIADSISYNVYDQSKQYYSYGTNAILSRFPIISVSPNDFGVCIQINEWKFGVFNIHLASYPYQPYQFAGIKSYPEEIFPFITTEIEAIEFATQARIPTIKKIFEEINYFNSLDKLDGIIIMGDMNEPSHRDWTSATVKAGRHPCSVEYPTIKYIEDNGFIDIYRHHNPDPVTHPGFTWIWKEYNKLNERIDYILLKGTNYNIIECNIINKKDWPSDHYGCYAIISFNKKDWQHKYLKYKQKYARIKIFSNNTGVTLSSNIIL